MVDCSNLHCLDAGEKAERTEKVVRDDNQQREASATDGRQCVDLQEVKGSEKK